MHVVLVNGLCELHANLPLQDCTTVCSSVMAFLDHLFECTMRSKYLDKDSVDFVCLQCGRKFDSENTVQQHVVKHQMVSIACKSSFL